MSKPPSRKIDRRDFVRTAVTAVAGGAAATSLTSCGPGDASGPAVHTRQRLQWRLASSYQRGLDTLFGVSEMLATTLEEMSEGMFRIRAYPSGELVPGLQVMDAVQQGTVQVGCTASYYFTGKNPALAFETGVPFGLTARQALAWMYAGGGRELMQELHTDFNIVSFPAGSTGAQMGGWFRREVETVADLEGLKMRIPGLGGEVMSRLGVTVQVLAGGDIYPALERGAIDATEWVGPYDDLKLGFHQIANYYYYPGWWEPGPLMSFYVNRDAWDGLSPDYQAMFRAAAAEAAAYLTARYDALNPPALRKLVDSGVQLRRFSDEILEAAYRESFDLYEEQAAADAGYRRVYEAWRDVRREMYAWFNICERAYADFAFPRVGDTS